MTVYGAQRIDLWACGETTLSRDTVQAFIRLVCRDQLVLLLLLTYYIRSSCHLSFYSL